MHRAVTFTLEWEVQPMDPPTKVLIPSGTATSIQLPVWVEHSGSSARDYMFKPTIGFGGEYSFRFAQAPYAGLNYRPKFYDFNAIWMPLGTSKQVAPEFQAGVGGASLSFYFPQQCINGIACSSSTYLVSSSHFQTHLSAGLRLYVKGGIFIRPQFDIHYVNNFYQFSSNWVPEYGAVIGYTFGRQ